ncbi:hypothetical protein P5673_010954 [Acropora cervicornis]|uniref:Uncharacterized protein n=1 Tax=Acropora cervicornis TaxID=6130 RepID=A0AAD9V906_ACRCE|nr:hypothetical protein P5673_010954 [Acropora cervicornis]
MKAFALGLGDEEEGKELRMAALKVDVRSYKSNGGVNYTERAENYKSENLDSALYINSLKVGRSTPMVGDSVINFFQSCHQVVPFNSFHGCFTTVPNFLKRIHALFKYSKISDFFLIQIKRSLFVINGNCRTLLCHLFKETNKQFCTLCLLSPGNGHQSFHQISFVYECLICETQPDPTDGTFARSKSLLHEAKT